MVADYDTSAPVAMPVLSGGMRHGFHAAEGNRTSRTCRSIVADPPAASKTRRQAAGIHACPRRAAAAALMVPHHLYAALGTRRGTRGARDGGSPRLSVNRRVQPFRMDAPMCHRLSFQDVLFGKATWAGWSVLLYAAP